MTAKYYKSLKAIVAPLVFPSTEKKGGGKAMRFIT